MILPLGDDNRDRRRAPLVTWTFIAINVLVFVFLQRFGNDYQFTYAFSAVPQEILTGRDVVTSPTVHTDPTTGARYTQPGLQPTPVSVYLTLLTSMFMHGGWAHLLGNMLYLWIFGDNVEDRIGRFRFVVFYLLCGVIATMSHVLTTRLLGQDLRVPTLGASGAISGALAALRIWPVLR